MIHSNLYNIKYLTQSFQYATEISDIFLMYWLWKNDTQNTVKYKKIIPYQIVYN